MSKVLGVSMFVAGVGLASCGEPPIRTPNPAESVVGVTVVPSSVVMGPGVRVNLTATVSAGPGQSNLRVRWTSTNPAVASVDSNGVVSSLAGGTATITATSLADSHFSGSSLIAVAVFPIGALTIADIEDDGAPADLTSLSGNIDVIVNVDTAATMILRVDAVLTGEKGDTTVASYSPSNSTDPPTGQLSAAPTTLRFNTLGLKNGQYLLKVRATRRDGGVYVSATVALTIKNP